MKYSIEYRGGEFIEILEIEGNTATKIWKRREGQPGLGTKF